MTKKTVTSQKSGGARVKRLRTVSLLPCLIGVIRGSWAEGAYVAHPLQCFTPSTPNHTPLLKTCPKGKHLIHLSQNWSEAIKSGLYCSSTEIANEVGFSSGRVRQIIRLTGLDPRITEYLSNLQGKKAVKQFAENKLRKYLTIPASSQFDEFQKLLDAS